VRFGLSGLDILFDFESFNPTNITDHIDYKITRVSTGLSGHSDLHGLKIE